VTKKSQFRNFIQVMRVDRVALVTGANRGIGLEIARQLAEKRIRVLMGARNLAQCEEAAKTLSLWHASVFPAELDVTHQDSVEKLTRKVASDFGRLDILVNNAGILIDESDRPTETKLETVRSTLETNLLGSWRLCQGFIPFMKRNDYGRIVNVSSGAGSLTEMPESLYAPAYSISKAALNALTIMLATELRASNVLVNAVCPGWVRSDMGGKDAPRSVEEGADTVVWLATLQDNGPTGGFFRDRTKIPW
jgi:NAD(P)-dependent dehydrogenase (short-subunit alcohol dehydrogenase family)